MREAHTSRFCATFAKHISTWLAQSITGESSAWGSVVRRFLQFNCFSYVRVADVFDGLKVQFKLMGFHPIILSVYDFELFPDFQCFPP